MFDDEEYIDFLNIRNWPRSFNKWIQVRKQQLLDQKNKLIEEMRAETNQVFQKMLDFKLQIKAVLKEGLIKLTSEERNDRVKAIDKLFEALGPSNTEKTEKTEKPDSGKSDRKENAAVGSKDKKKEKIVIQYEIPMFISFDWLAQLAGWTKKKFDSRLI